MANDISQSKCAKWHISFKKTKKVGLMRKFGRRKKVPAAYLPLPLCANQSPTINKFQP